MKYTVDPDIAGLVVFEPDVFYDVRGEYINTFNTKDYAFLNEEFVEDDFSMSRKNVLRGMHGDPETKKLIQCLYGSILLGVADLRADSPSYLPWRVENPLLSERDANALYLKDMEEKCRKL